jgi:hypothetical protein
MLQRSTPASDRYGAVLVISDARVAEEHDARRAIPIVRKRGPSSHDARGLRRASPSRSSLKHCGSLAATLEGLALLAATRCVTAVTPRAPTGFPAPFAAIPLAGTHAACASVVRTPSHRRPPNRTSSATTEGSFGCRTFRQQQAKVSFCVEVRLSRKSAAELLPQDPRDATPQAPRLARLLGPDRYRLREQAAARARQRWRTPAPARAQSSKRGRTDTGSRP